MSAAGVGIAPTLSMFQTDVQTNYTIQRIKVRSSRGNEAQFFDREGERPREPFYSEPRYLGCYTNVIGPSAR